MQGVNRVTLLGNLTADSELRFTQGGQAVLSIRLATNESYLDKDKVRKDRVDYHSVVVWGKRGEALAKLLTKGSPVFIEGSLRTSSYDDREGNKRYKTEVIATNVVLVGGKREHAEGSADDGRAQDGERHASRQRVAGNQRRGHDGRGQRLLPGDLAGGGVHVHGQSAVAVRPGAVHSGLPGQGGLVAEGVDDQAGTLDLGGAGELGRGHGGG